MQIIALLLCTTLHMAYAAPVTLILNPAGDAKTTGRHINDSFERSCTLQLAQTLKKQLEQKVPTLSVLLTRLPGDVAEPLQYATFANRIDADIYLSIHCFQEDLVKPRLYIYQFSYGETFALPKNSLACYTYDQAHLLNLNQTISYGTTLKTVLSDYEKLFDVHGPYQIPFAPLVGITCPALGIEIGLKKNGSWNDFVEPLADAIKTILSTRKIS